MPIHFRCACGRAFNVPSELAGKKARCNQCQAEIEIPPPEETEFELTPLGGPAAEPADEEFQLTPLGSPAQQAPRPAPRPAAVAPAPRPIPQPAPAPRAALPASRPAVAGADQLLPLDAPDSDALDDPLASPLASPAGQRPGKRRKQGGGIDWGSPVTLSAIGGGGLALLLLVAIVWTATRQRGPVVAQAGAEQQPGGVPAVLPGGLPPSAQPLPPTTASVSLAPPPAALPTTPAAIVTPSEPPAGPPAVEPPTPRETNVSPNPTPRPKAAPKLLTPKQPPPVQRQPADPNEDQEGQEEGQQDTESLGERRTVGVDPTELGILVPRSGKVTPGGGRRVQLRDENNQLVVGTVHAQIEDYYVVVLPTGRLASAHERDVSPTDRPFEAATREEVVTRLHDARFKNYQTAVSDHYGFVYQCTEDFFQTTRDILESMHDGVLEQLRAWELPASEPTLPLITLIFPDRKSFDAFERMPPEVAAYYDPVQNYVVLYENPELSDAAPEYALKKSSYIVAHEAIHQLLHNCGIQQRLARWPQWVSEGLPEYFCPVRVTSSMVSKGGASLPARKLRWTKAGMVNDLRMRTLLRVRVSNGEIMETIAGAEGLTSHGYAMAWGLTHYLASKKLDDFRAYLKELAAIEPLAHLDPDHADARSSLFAKHLGANYPQLEGDVAKHLNSATLQQAYRDPAIYQTHYVVVHNMVRGKSALIHVGITLSPTAARQWKERQEREQAPGVRHGFRTEVCPTRKDAEILLTRLMRG